MSAVADAPHRLLVSHFTNWTQAKGREVDVQLLEGLLDLRATYDDLEPTLWPAGSVQDLLLRLLPAKGPAEPLPSDATVDALDAYFRFLRSTGRMSARSATPADLAKEARRSAKKMAAAARDRTNWSPPKGNLSGRTRAMTSYQTDIEMEALIRSFTYEMPQGGLPSPQEAAQIIREAALIGQLEALTRWIEPGAEVTATGVLRPAAARQAFADLDLVSWMRESLRIDYAEMRSGVSPEEMETLLDTVAQLQTWRSARDCLALDRLWNAALTCRVIRIEGRWAYAAWPEQLDDEAIVNLATDAGLDLLFSFLDDDPAFGLPVLGYALLRSYVRRPRPVPLEEIADFAESWVLPPSERAGPAYDLSRRLIRSSMRHALHSLSDLGIFSQTTNEIVLNAWGDVFVSAWLSVELPVSDDDG
jgi:hypothetical protein